MEVALEPQLSRNTGKGRRACHFLAVHERATALPGRAPIFSEDPAKLHECPEDGMLCMCHAMSPPAVRRCCMQMGVCNAPYGAAWAIRYRNAPAKRGSN